MKFTTFCHACHDFLPIVDEGLCIDCFVKSEWSKVGRIMAIGLLTAVAGLSLTLWLLR